MFHHHLHQILTSNAETLECQGRQVSQEPEGPCRTSKPQSNGWAIHQSSILSTQHEPTNINAQVYQCAWSADSRLLVTGSKDCTLKVWNARNGNLAMDLPGHEDEVCSSYLRDHPVSRRAACPFPVSLANIFDSSQVYAVDWAADGKMVGSGGKDKAVRTWRN